MSSEMPVKDVVSYNVMIAGFANHGHGEGALKLFPRMLKGWIWPDAVAFLGILTACSHAGLVDVGCWYFDRMSKEVEPSGDHRACMVDLFGPAGLIEEAYDLVKTMVVEPHSGVWGALTLAGHFAILRLAKIAARELFRIKPGNPGNYVFLFNTYLVLVCWMVLQMLEA